MGGWFADIFVEYLFRVFSHAMNLVRSRKWPIAKATVLSADCEHRASGCTVATVYYEYVVNGDRYGDAFGKPFISQESARHYVAHFVKGMDLKVRVKPRDPTTSVPLWEPPSCNLI